MNGVCVCACHRVCTPAAQEKQRTRRELPKSPEYIGSDGAPSTHPVNDPSGSCSDATYRAIASLSNRSMRSYSASTCAARHHETKEIHAVVSGERSIPSLSCHCSPHSDLSHNHNTERSKQPLGLFPHQMLVRRRRSWTSAPCPCKGGPRRRSAGPPGAASCVRLRWVTRRHSGTVFPLPL